MSAQVHLIEDNGIRYEEYEQARILSNGWVKATEPTGGSDYYPPHKVDCVTGRVYIGDANEL